MRCCYYIKIHNRYAGLNPLTGDYALRDRSRATKFKTRAQAQAFIKDLRIKGLGRVQQVCPC